MATYLLVNVLFFAISLLALRIQRVTKAHVGTLAALLILTAVFDSIIINLGVVAYDQEKILGLYVGIIPIEDFFYTIVAVIIIPAIWNRLGGPNNAKT